MVMVDVEAADLLLRDRGEDAQASGGVLGGGCVAVEDLFAVGTSGFGGAVGVEDQLPAAAVDADVVVVLAGQDEVVDRCLAAVLLVAQVVHVAVDGGAAAF